jgi:hypothetical protein
MACTNVRRHTLIGSQLEHHLVAIWSEREIKVHQIPAATKLYDTVELLKCN